MMKPHVNKDLMIVYQEIAVSITKKRPFFGHLKREFFTSKARLNFEAYGQQDKIPPAAGEKWPLF